MRQGSEALARRGLLDDLAATGCPPIREYSSDFGPFAVAAAPLATATGVAVEECAVVGMRARESGGGATRMTAYADLVVGADGGRSTLAAAVGAGPLS